MTNGFLCGVTQSQNVAMSLSFILTRVQMRERLREWDWLRAGPHSGFVLYSIVYPKLHYLSDLKGTISFLSSSKKYFCHLSRAQVQLITWSLGLPLISNFSKNSASNRLHACQVLSLDDSCLLFTEISDSDLSGPEKALITQLRQRECDKKGGTEISDARNTNVKDLEKH